MRKLFLILAVVISIANAGMIDWEDDDRVQWLTFEDCDPDSIAQVIEGFCVNLDSGFVETTHALSDSVDFTGRYGLQPDRDQNGHAIPGHYHGEYWWYLKSITFAGDTIAAMDTNHVVVDYTIPGGCGGIFHVD